MSVFTTNQENKNLTYMTDVDAALHRRGHPWAFTLTVAVFLFFIVVYIWADFTLLDDVVRGNGKVIPAAGIRDIQSDKGGTISELRVKEGDTVEPNQIVAVIANVQDVSTLRELQERSIDLALSLIRFEAQAEAKPLRFPQVVIDEHPEVVQNQIQIFDSNTQQADGEDSQLQSQISQRQNEVEAALETKTHIESSLVLLQNEVDAVKNLVGRSYSEISYLNLQQRMIALKGELSEVEQTIARAESAASSAQDRLITRAAERRAAIAVERNKNRVEMEAINQRIQTWTEQVGRAELRSPVAGTIKDILYKEGAVARPADVIMEIIATDEVLEIEARFAPADRGFLYLSQKGMAKFSAYDFSIYGGLEAAVTRISDDTILDKRGEGWYEVRLITTNKSIHFRGKEHPILPGMTVTIDLLTDKRSVLDRILGPLKRAQENAMTEH